jgi:hypothetical protein
MLNQAIDMDDIKVYLVKDVDTDTFVWVIGKFVDNGEITMYPLLKKQSKKLQLEIRRTIIEKGLIKESIVTKFKLSKKIKILPWIGENYLNEEHKILILGISTSYEDATSKKDCVIDLVRKICEGEKWKEPVYWTKIANLLKNDKEKTEDFWNRISFYNYIQEIMEGPKQKTPKEYWEDAKEPFKEILKKLMPDIVIVTGYELFNNLPNEFDIQKPIKKNGKELKISYYFARWKNIQKSIAICGIWHPSTHGFKYTDWKNLLKKYYKEREKDWAEFIKALKAAEKFVVMDD